MNLRTWSIQHTKGLIVGLITLIICSFIVIGILTWQSGGSYQFQFNKFIHIPSYTAKVISLAAIGNLPWFHFLSLKQGKWEFGQGIIMATVIALIVMLLFKFVL